MWQEYIIAKSLDEALTVLSEKSGTAKIIAGGTDLMLEIKRGQRKQIKTLIDISRISSLGNIFEENGIIHVGAMATHADVLGSSLLRQKAQPLYQACLQVGSPQIRNRGTVAGNLVTASPANDTISPLMAMNASLVLQSMQGKRVIPIEAFYQGVRKTVMQPDEILVDVLIPALQQNQKGIFVKSALRKAQAISVVNAALVLSFDRDAICAAKITLGAVAPTIIFAKAAQDWLIGKNLSAELLESIPSLIASAIKPISDLRGSKDYREYTAGLLVKQALSMIMTGRDLLDEKTPVLLNVALHVNQATDYSGDVIKTTINQTPFLFKKGQKNTLINLIRDQAGFTGTKEGCGEGECGACTIHMDGKAVLACLIPAPCAHGATITTIEGMADGDDLHPLQKAFIEAGAVQCGYCTPGFIMSAAMLLEENPAPDRDEILQAISGNLCRCTGYYKIVEAIEHAIESKEAQS